MSQEIRVQAPPAKPLMVFDGDCNFCRRWIARWKNATGDAVDYLPFQDETIPVRFPEIPRKDFAEAVHLILPSGSVTRGAEAVFRSLSEGGSHRWLLSLYQRVSGFADLSELLYEEVATHRESLSKLDRIYSGPGVALPTHKWVRFAFLRGLAVIYFIAFGSLWVQMDGLIGSRGIVPVQRLMEALKEEAAKTHIGLDRIHLVPTFAWWSASDTSLHWQCGLGMGCALALLVGAAPALMLLLLWALYLSLSVVSGPFFSFQWDQLLLETGFLAIFFAPLQLWERPSRQSRPPSLVLWLLRWLLFRLMFESGCVKLMSGDASWWNLSALRVHFETQPLPTSIAWWVHQWPSPALAFCTGAMFFIELVVPIFLAAGRRLRLLAAGLFVAFQVAIILTGNYGFFNWLAILLCIPLLDDKALAFLFGRQETAPEKVPNPARRAARWPWPITLLLTVIVVPVTLIPLLIDAGVRQAWPRPVVWVYAWTLPFRSFNAYGLFAVMTQKRPEIIVQGSDDGKTWKDYEFKYKPGDDLRQAPKFVAPYQPRLDWQMWFGALGGLRENPWFLNLGKRLLENSPPVLALLGPNPFPKQPPKYIRALLYEYHFTNRETRRKTGDWWRRELIGLYAPPLSIKDFQENTK